MMSLVKEFEDENGQIDMDGLRKELQVRSLRFSI